MDDNEFFLFHTHLLCSARQSTRWQNNVVTFPYVHSCLSSRPNNYNSYNLDTDDAFCLIRSVVYLRRDDIEVSVHGFEFPCPFESCYT